MAHRDPHRLARERDGGARVRLRLTGEQADAVERAAGDVPVLEWLLQMVEAAAEPSPVAAGRHAAR